MTPDRFRIKIYLNGVLISSVENINWDQTQETATERRQCGQDYRIEKIRKENFHGNLRLWKKNV